MAAETIPVDDFDPASLDSGIDTIAVGGYHLGITAYLPDPPKADNSIAFDCEVLAGNVAQQEGKHTRFYLNKLGTGAAAEDNLKAKRNYFTFAIAAKLTSEEEIKAAKAAGRGVAIDWDLAVGRDFKGEITSYDGKNGKKYNLCPWKIWPCESPKASHIPMNKGAHSKVADVPANGDIFGGDDQF